jgi:hypothetical protein
MRVYDMLQKAQGLTGPSVQRKYVYVFASHSHFFEEDIYNTQEHAGKVLPGWIIGTGGAEQYRDTIMYGYPSNNLRNRALAESEKPITALAFGCVKGIIPKNFIDKNLAIGILGARLLGRRPCGPVSSTTPQPSIIRL